MTQGTIIPPAVDQDSIEYGHVYANYVKSVADTPGDPDADPDIIHVNGQVTFDSTFPGASARGSIRLPADPRAYGLIVTGDTFKIAESKLIDHEGRPGVRLVASVDGVPISWQAVVTLEDSSGRTIYNQAYIIHYDLWDKQGNLLDINLPDLIPTPSRLEPPEGAAVRLAEKALEEIEALTATSQQVKLDVEGLKSEVVTLHGQTGQRLTAAEAARAAAVTAKNAAEAAQSASETARSQAQTARTGAQTARTGAETARDRAEAAKTQIDTAHNHIHQDVEHVDTQAQAAGAAAQTAITKAGEASDSASTATTKASEAAQSRADALTFRNTAQGAATTATDKAGEASASAANAKSSETNAAADALTLAQRVETGTKELGVTSDGKLYFLDQPVEEVPLRVDNTVGTRVFLGDVMIFGDTGWVNINHLIPVEHSGNLLIRRTRDLVFFNASWLNFTDTPANTGISLSDPLPIGWRPAVNNSEIFSNGASAVNRGGIGVTFGGNTTIVQLGTTSLNGVVEIAADYDSWPTSLEL